MVIKLTCHVCRRYKYEPITDGDQFTKALKQLFPLATFPMVFFIFEIPVFLYHVYTTQHSTPNEGLSIAKNVCASLWSMASGATVIIHISVTQICGRKRKPIHSHTLFTQRVTTGSHASSATHFSLPLASVWWCIVYSTVVGACFCNLCPFLLLSFYTRCSQINANVLYQYNSR